MFLHGGATGILYDIVPCIAGPWASLLSPTKCQRYCPVTVTSQNILTYYSIFSTRTCSKFVLDMSDIQDFLVSLRTKFKLELKPGQVFRDASCDHWQFSFLWQPHMSFSITQPPAIAPRCLVLARPCLLSCRSLWLGCPSSPCLPRPPARTAQACPCIGCTSWQWLHLSHHSEMLRLFVSLSISSH